MIRARKARACAVLRRETYDSRTDRSASVSSILAAENWLPTSGVDHNPLTLITFFWSGTLAGLGDPLGGEVIVRNLGAAEAEVGDDVLGRQDLEDRERGDRRVHVGMELERGRAAPGALDHEVAYPELDDLADARREVYVRDLLQQEPGPRHRLRDRSLVELFVLVAHRRGRDPHAVVVQRADDRVAADLDARAGEHLRIAHDLAPRRDGGEGGGVHRVGVAARLAVERHRDDLPGLVVVAEAGRVRHADELVPDDGRGRLERRRDHLGDRGRIRPVSDDEELTVHEVQRALVVR